MLNRTSCQMCGRWYLPIFLFRDGSLTLIYGASLMVLIRFWSSLPTKSNHQVIYRYKCDRVECDDEYIEESSRTFGERFKEHQKAPSPIFDHYNTTGHKISIENFDIVVREDQNLMRTIKEAPYIRVNDPSLNRNIGKYHLPHIWHEVLFNISELKIIITDQGNTICLLAITSANHHPAVAIPSATWQ